jgi:ATP synthase protein I
MTTDPADEPPPDLPPPDPIPRSVPPPSLRVPGLSQALLATALVGVVMAVAAGLTGGRAEVLGTAVGVALVCGFFLFGAFNTSLAAAYAPRASMLVALLTYTVQVVGLALVLVAISESETAEDALDVRWLGGTVIVGTLVWTGALVARTLSGPAVRR